MRAETEGFRHTGLVRKLIHLAMTVVPLVAWLVSYPLALLLAALFLAASVLVEATRRWWLWVNRLLWQLLPTTFRAWEDERVLGSTWFALGMMATYLLFGRDVGGTAILFLIWGDTAAEFVGRTLGRSDQGKTLAGSTGCLVVCLLAGWLGVELGGLNPLAVLAGAVVATLVERWPPPPDDNLWMPALSGLAITAVQFVVTG